MQYRPLGKTGLRISQLGYGAASLGEEYGAIDPSEGERSVHVAIDAGINYFDVAPYYGSTLAETRLGAALDGRRNKVVLATKVGRYKDEHGRETFDFSAAGIRSNLEQSLGRLKTDVIDVYQAHDIEFVPRQQMIQEALPALQALKQEGKIRCVGITAYPLNVMKEIAEEARVDMILSYSRYHLLDTSLEDVLGEFSAQQGVGLINASPLNMGLLTEKGPPDWHPATQRVKAAVLELITFCRSRGVHLSQLAMQFALSYRHAASTLVGMSRVRHVERNLAALNDQVDQQLIDEVLQICRPFANICWQEGLPENHDPGSVPQFS
ncbi:MAG: aldo/keto reductase [Aeoliella sp.]